MTWENGVCGSIRLRCGLHRLETTARDHARASTPFVSTICRAVAAGGADTAATSSAVGDDACVVDPAVWSSLQGACVACYLQSTEGASTASVGRQVVAALGTFEQGPLLAALRKCVSTVCSLHPYHRG